MSLIDLFLCPFSHTCTDTQTFTFIPVAPGRLLHPRSEGAEGEVPEEPWVLTAGQSAVPAPGVTWSAGVFPGDAVRSTGGARGRVSVCEQSRTDDMTISGECLLRWVCGII